MHEKCGAIDEPHHDVKIASVSHAMNELSFYEGMSNSCHQSTTKDTR